MKRFLLALALIIISASASVAQIGGLLSGPSAYPGRTVMNLGFPGFGAMEFLNNFKSCGSMQSGTFPYPSIADVNGYPNSAPSTTQFCVIGGTGNPFTFNDNPNMVLKFSGTGSITLTGTFTSISDPGSCVTGNLLFSITVRGTNCRAVFKYTNGVASTNVQFLTTGTYAPGFGNAVLVREDKESLLDAGEIFNPDFITALLSTNPRVLRFIDWQFISPSNNVPRSRYGAPVAAFSYINHSFYPNNWAGTVSGTDTYTVGNAPENNPAAYEDGEVVQGIITNASVTSSVTLNRGGLGAKNVGIIGGSAIPTSGSSSEKPTANSLATFVYDAALDKYLWSSGGLTTQIPIEVVIALCNKVHRDCWIQWPVLFDQASAMTYITYARDNLAAGLKLYIEFSNEMWAFSNRQTQYAALYGDVVFGWSTGAPTSLNRVLGFYGLRVCQYMPAALAAWNTTRSASDLIRIATTQTVMDLTTWATYFLDGLQIDPATYPAVPKDCKTAGVRPDNSLDAYSYAPYLQGGQIKNFAPSYKNTMTETITAVDNILTNTPASIAAAMAFMNNDFRVGFQNGTLQTQNLPWAVINFLPQWKAFALARGKPIDQYEGGIDPVAPTAAQLTTLGITNSAMCADAQCIANGIQSLIYTWRNSDGYRQFVNDAMMTHVSVGGVRYPAWFQFLRSSNPPSNWALFPNTIYVSQATGTGTISGTTLTLTAVASGKFSVGQTISGSTTSVGTTITALGTGTGFTGTYTINNSQTVGTPFTVTATTNVPAPFKSLDALANFGTSFPYLLKRDLDPASNDNTPAWLNKAA